MSKEKYQKQWESISQRVEKANSELLCLTYGSLVTQLLKDFENVESINAQLEKMGYNIGIRLVDDFLAKSGQAPCGDFKETAEVVAKLGLRMFLGVCAEVTNWDAEGRSCSLILTENPLTDFVELPPALARLQYSILICGVIRGSLEQTCAILSDLVRLLHECVMQLRMRVSCYFVRDMLKGDDVYEMRLELKELMKDEFEDDEEG